MTADMQATIAPPEERILMDNISWQTYESLLAESVGSPGHRFTYDNGTLEIMVVYVGHENPKRVLENIVELTAAEKRQDCFDSASTTLKRSELLKGCEPDSSFYFRHAAAMRELRGKRELDLQIDPPPELAIEVDITRSSLPRFPIFAAIGIGEVWRYDGKRVRFYALDADNYQEMEASIVLPPMTASQATKFLDLSSRIPSWEWHAALRDWVRSQI
jgi:Uma2 family endonuclease